MTEPPAGRPTLVIISGPPGTGKTTLAHRLAGLIGCPALCRDEIKEGMIAANSGLVSEPSDQLDVSTYGLFFAAIRLFLQHGVTHVAEAAFQHENWARGLEPMRTLAELRIVRCQTASALAKARVQRRRLEQPSRAAHDDSHHISGEQFEHIRLGAPTLDVDTTNGYRPELGAVARFLRSY